MNCLLHFRRYRLPLRVAVRTAHGVMTEREGIIVRLQEAGRVGFGEVAPLPEFGTESVETAETVLRKLGECVTAEQLAAGAGSECVGFALAGAQAEIFRQVGEPQNYAPAESLPMAALLPAGRAAVKKIAALGETGFRTFKWKVGVAPVAEELPLLDDLCAELPPGARLRLDANGAWDRRAAERWLERCADRPIEFVEQPIARDTRGAEDVLRGLAADWPTKLALDESLTGPDDLARWLAAGWPGVFVVKLALLGDPAAVLARLRTARADVVFSTALETAVGARAVLRAALMWEGARAAGGESEQAGVRSQESGVPIHANPETPTPRPDAKPPRALGFGVWPLFADARFDGPWMVPFLRISDVERLNPEAVWNALS